MSEHVRQTEPFRWDGIEVRPYKSEGRALLRASPARCSSTGGDGLGCELRYFEIAPGGWSSLERHHHAHAVMIVRGRARVLVGDRIVDAGTHDLVRVPPLTWHQFQPAGEEPLGFLCMVDCDRDVPERPDAEALAALRRDDDVATFIRA